MDTSSATSSTSIPATTALLHQRATLSVWDYVFFCGSLVVYLLVGIKYALQGRKSKQVPSKIGSDDVKKDDAAAQAFMRYSDVGDSHTSIKTQEDIEAEEYFLGGQSLHLIPTAVSLFASFFSAITMIGSPGEMYTNGLVIGGQAFAIVNAALLGAFIGVPFLYGLKVVNMNEYVEMRYGARWLRLVMTIIVFVTQLNYMVNATFAPCAAFQAMSGIDERITVVVTVVLTIFYTSMGGLAAVVLVDLIQGLIMIGGALTIALVGVYSAGGFAEVWSFASETGRLNLFDMRGDPRLEYSFWSITFGGGMNWFYWLAFTQTAFQRVRCLKTRGQAQAAYWLLIPQGVLIYGIVAMTSLAIFAWYNNVVRCDPLQLNGNNKNELLGTYLVDVLNYPPLPGIYMAGMFSGGLSTLSSGYNAMAALIWEDMLKDRLRSSKHKTAVMQGLTVLIGVLCMVFSFALRMVKGASVYKTIQMFGAMFDGAALSVFVFGTFIPVINKWGVVSGSLAAISIVLSMSIGQTFLADGIDGRYDKDIQLAGNETSITPGVTDMCWNVSWAQTDQITTPAVGISTLRSFEDVSIFEKYFFGISFQYYTPLAMTLYLIVALIVSFITGPMSRHDCPKQCLYWYWKIRKICCCKDDEVDERWAGSNVIVSTDPQQYDSLMVDNEDPSELPLKAKLRPHMSHVAHKVTEL